MSAANNSPFESNTTDLTEQSQHRRRWLRVGFWIIAVILGFAHAWADRHYLENTDAMSYLDVAEAYLRADWGAAINTYWGPLYSWLTALVFLLVKPAPYWKFALLHLVNFTIYLIAFGCFDCLINQLIHYQRSRHNELITAGLINLPGWAWLALGYPLCLWSLLYLVKIREESPDMLVAAAVFLAGSIVLRMLRHPGNWVLWVLLGVTLGLGYLSKAVMLPVSLAFMAVTLFLNGGFRKGVPRVIIVGIAFLIIAGPFIFAMSRSKGRLTFGESGRLNYLWAIDGIKDHWQGDTPGYGLPKHPTRKVFDKPGIYEFGEPISGTYPVWFDPTYWYEGSVTRFSFRGQLRALGRNAQVYYELFGYGVHYGLLLSLLILYLISGRRWMVLHDLTPYWFLIVLALAGMGIYSLINVQGRYIAPFLVLLWLALFSAVRLPNSRESHRLISITVVALMTTMLLTIAGSSIREVRATASYLLLGEDRSSHEQWQVAEDLQQIGVTAPDRVAVIGNSGRSFWAYLAGLRIVAEIPRDSVAGFWAADGTVKNKVFNTFAGTGAKVIVTESPPPGTDMTGWKQLGNGTHYYYSLAK
jgi:hypothetical protein